MSDYDPKSAPKPISIGDIPGQARIGQPTSDPTSMVQAARGRIEAINRDLRQAAADNAIHVRRVEVATDAMRQHLEEIEDDFRATFTELDDRLTALEARITTLESGE